MSASLRLPWLAGVLVLVLAAVAASASETPDSLRTRIDEARARGDYEAALEQARSLLELSHASDAAPFDTKDAELLVATLEKASALPAAERRELARADSLKLVSWERTGEHRWEEVRVASEERLVIVKRILGARHPEVASTLANVGGTYLATRDLDRAQGIFEEALSIDRATLPADHPSIAEVLNNLSGCATFRGDYESAEKLSRDALDITRRAYGERHAKVGLRLNNLGSLLMTRGDYASAEPLLRRGLALEREFLGEEHPAIATDLSNLGVLKKRQGDFASAERLYREAVAIDRKVLPPDHPDLAIDLNNLASLLNAVGRHGDAEPLQKEALAINQKVFGPDHPAVAQDHGNLAVLYIAMERLDEAKAQLDSSREIQEKAFGKEHPEVAKTLQTEAELAKAHGNFAQAETSSRQALEIRLKTLGDAHPLTARNFHDLALLVRAQGRAAGAESLLASAADSFEKARVRAGPGVSRATFARSPYADLAAARLALGRESDAWTAAEAAQGRALADLLRGTSRSAAPFALERIQATLPKDCALVGWLDVTTLTRESESWGWVVRRGGPVRWQRLPASGTAEAAQVRESLASAGSSPLGGGWSKTAAAAARALGKARMGPLEPLLSGVDRLVIVPSGPMLGIPVDALTDAAGKFFADRWAITYIPSGTVFAWLQEAQATRADAPHGGTALLLGDPPFATTQVALASAARPVAGAGGSMPMPRGALTGDPEAVGQLPRLAWTRVEVEKLAPLWPKSTVLLGGRASEEELYRMAGSDELRNYRVVHFATHALVDDDEPGRSALVLSQVDRKDPLEAALKDERVFDGLLRADEIVREWKLDADLVTLSGCETARGRDVVGEGYVGLAHAFLQTGARSLLVSLWQVDDEATSLLMQHFYEAWLSGATTANALRDAKKWLRGRSASDGREFAHPYYWAGFVLVGIE